MATVSAADAASATDRGAPQAEQKRLAAAISLAQERHTGMTGVLSHGSVLRFLLLFLG